MAQKQKMTPMEKITKKLEILNTIRSEISDFDSAISHLSNEGAKQKLVNVRKRLVEDRDYMVLSILRGGVKAIEDGNKVDQFVNALPSILK